MKTTKKYIGSADSYSVSYSGYGNSIKYEIVSATNHDLLAKGHYSEEHLTIKFLTSDNYIRRDVFDVIMKVEKDWYYSVEMS